MARPRITRVVGKKNAGAAVPAGAGSNVATAPIASNNNATNLLMWDGLNDYAQILYEDEFPGSQPASITPLTDWHNNRKVRGWITSGNSLYWSTAVDHYNFYDGTGAQSVPRYSNPYYNWMDFEATTVAYPYASKAPQNRGHRTCGVAGLANPYTTSGNGTPLWPWHLDTNYGTSGGAAAVAAGEGSAAWNAAVASALSPAATFVYGGQTLRTVCADFKMLCQTLALFGHTGFAWDAEMYGYSNADSSSWSSSYPSMPGGQSAATTRLYVKLRGQQLATIQAAQMPNSRIYFYHQRITGGWFELYRYALFGASSNVFANYVYDSFIAGLASITGIDKVLLGESEFYKGPVMSSWDNAYLYDHNGILARMSTLFTDAERLAAMRRLGLCGMNWPTSGSTDSELGNAMAVGDFTSSLTAAVKWSMFGDVIVWALAMSDAVQGGGNQTQDHGVYEPSFQAALVPANVDSTSPVLSVTQGASSSGSATTITISGNATDNMCIHTVEWSNALTGGTGAFQTTVNNQTANWNPPSGSAAPQNGAAIVIRRDFTGSVPVSVGVNVITITARDTHGNVTNFVHTHTRS